MESATAILREAPRRWEEERRGDAPQIRVLPAPSLPEAPSRAEEFAVVPTPIRRKGTRALARFGPPVVFALTLLGIYWFWPPF